MQFLVIGRIKLAQLIKLWVKHFILSLILLAVNPVGAATNIEFWHSMTGKNGLAVAHLISAFNRSHPAFHITGKYKGDYAITFTSLVAAMRAHQGPDIVQIYEVGTATMLHPKGIVKSVSSIIHRYQPSFALDQLLPPMSRYYSDEQGELMAWPFNVSTPILFYNKDAFAKSALDPNRPPKTWLQVQDYSRKLRRNGYSCGFTTTWPAWILLEEFADRHLLSFATGHNGFASTDVKLLLAQPVITHTIATLQHWQQARLFCYGGREDDAQILFLSGHAAIILSSSGGYADLAKLSHFRLGVGPLPYWRSPKLPNPGAASIGGGALWVMNNHDENKDAGIAAFLVFLAAPAEQAYWLQKTGYLPITWQAMRAMVHAPQAQTYTAQRLALQQLLMSSRNHDLPSGRRLGNYGQLREIEARALEAVFAGTAQPNVALSQANSRGDRLLMQFRDAVGET